MLGFVSCFCLGIPPCPTKSATSPVLVWFRSFYSGHTTLAFALATSMGTVASMRRYRLAPLVWALGIPLATLTGLLRMSADRHYLTDVLTGAVLGGGMGFLGPFLHRKQKPVLTPLVTSTRSVGVGGLPSHAVGLTVGLTWTGPLH